MRMITYASFGRHAKCVDLITPQDPAIRHHLIVENANMSNGTNPQAISRCPIRFTYGESWKVVSVVAVMGWLLSIMQVSFIVFPSPGRHEHRDLGDRNSSPRYEIRFLLTAVQCYFGNEKERFPPDAGGYPA